MQEVSAEADRLLARLRAAFEQGDRAGAATLLVSLRENAEKNGLNLLAKRAAKLEETVYLESETNLTQGLEFMLGENRRLSLALGRLGDPDARREFHLDPPSTGALHQRFMTAFGF